MSQWIDITDQADVKVSEDGKEIEVLFESDQFGNRYINIPVEFVLVELARNGYSWVEAPKVENIQEKP